MGAYRHHPADQHPPLGDDGRTHPNLIGAALIGNHRPLVGFKVTTHHLSVDRLEADRGQKFNLLVLQTLLGEQRLELSVLNRERVYPAFQLLVSLGEVAGARKPVPMVDAGTQSIEAMLNRREHGLNQSLDRQQDPGVVQKN